MSGLEIPFTVVGADWDEEYDANMDVNLVPQFLAYKKAQFVKERLQVNQIILTADTVVIQNGKLLGKPKDKEEAKVTLENLSNKTHTVITGTTLMSHEKNN